VILTSDQATVVEITTLGRFRVRYDDRDVIGLRRQPVRASLLVYLAMEREATRDTLVGMFWPDFTEGRARNALSQTLHRLRRDLGDWMRAEGEAVVVAEGVAVDACAFERAVQRGDRAAALDLYAGPFLAGWRLLDAHEIQLWIDRQRSRLARLHEDAVAARIRELEEAGEMALAVTTALRWVELSPLAEEAHATLIRLLARSGDRSGAGRQYEAFARAVAAEELEISPAVTDELDRILTEAVVSPPATAAPPRPGVLVEPFRNQTGRDELAPLGTLIADWITEGLDRTGMVAITPLLETLRAVATGSGKAASAADATIGYATVARPRFIIRGSYYMVSGALQVRGQILDRDSGEVAGTMEPVRAGVADEETAVTLTRDRILGLLAALLDQDWAGLPTPPELGSRPPTLEAYRAYSRGVDHFLRQEYSRAIAALEEACRLDKDLGRPLLLAATSHANLGQWEHVGPLLDRLDAVADRLSPYEADGLRFHRARLQGDREAAYALTKRWRRYPGTAAHFVAGVCALENNRPQETVEIYRELDPCYGWVRHFHPYWEMLTAAHHMLGHHDLELEAARAGRRIFPSLVASLAYEVQALAAGGDVAGVRERLDGARDLPPQHGWSWGRVAEVAALELRAHERPGEAAEYARLAAEWFREQGGDTRLRPGALTGLAHSLYLAGELAEAESLYRDLAAAFSQNLDYAGRLGVLAARRGDAEAAARIDHEIEQLTRPFLFGRDSLWRARIAARRGQAVQALQLLRRAVAEGHPFGLWLHTDTDLEPLRSEPVYRELVRPKGCR
jgi:DNA-binding SARP family transcriptional activator